MAWALKRCQDLLRRALSRYRLLDDGEAVVVGVSGGADSLCLLHLLHDFNTRNDKRWTLHPVHVDPGFEGWNSKRTERACARIGLPCHVIRLRAPALSKEPGDVDCFLCARERRRALFRVADGIGCGKVALAHHLEDVNETFLMNLLFTSSGATMVPRQSLFRGRLAIIRPLYYFDSEQIRRYLRRFGLRPVLNRCPSDRTSSRAQVRRILERFYSQNRRIKYNLFWGIHNLKPEYLPG